MNVRPLQPSRFAPFVDIAALTARTNAAAASWDDEAMLPVLLRATADAPTDARPWQLLGLAQRNLDAHADALVSFRKATSLAPRDALLMHALARTSMEAGLPAVDLYERALGLAPLDAPILLGRAAAQFAEQGAQVAIDGLRDQLRQHPAWYQGHATVARLYWLSNARERIGDSFEEALALRPADGPLWRDYAFVLLGARDHEGIRAIVTRARRALGPSRILDLIEGIARSEAGDIAAADALFTAHLPIEDGYLAHYARHMLRAGRPAEVAAMLAGRIAGDPTRELLPLAAIAWRMTGDPRWDALYRGTDFVGVFDLADEIATIPNLADRLRALHRASQHPFDQSLRGGTQTDGPLFSRLDPEIQALRSVIIRAVGRYVDGLPAPVADHPFLGVRRAPLRFAGSWSVRLTDGGHHVDHVHPAGWISSAFYVVVPDGAETDAHRAGWLTLGDAPSLQGSLEPIATIAPKPGRLVLFPSTMWHRTMSFPQGERLTVAFDIARPPR